MALFTQAADAMRPPCSVLLLFVCLRFGCCWLPFFILVIFGCFLLVLGRMNTNKNQLSESTHYSEALNSGVTLKPCFSPRNRAPAPWKENSEKPDLESPPE